jgi:hypothetical protein
MSLAGRLAVLTSLILPAALAGGCDRSGAAPPPVAARAPQPIRFRDVGAEAGVQFPQFDPDPAKMTILEINAGGAGLLDYDGDGRLDLLLIGLHRLGLFHNEGNGRFRAVPDRAGLPEKEAWTGCAAADLDGDGQSELLLTGHRVLRLYRSDGGRFVDVTSQSGFRSDLWSTSAAFADFDNDGDLDLYVGAYVRFGPASRKYCPIGLDPKGGVVTGPCGPEPYDAERGRLYESRGGRFRDVTGPAGLSGATGKTLGVAVGDYDGDGLIDLYLANDRVPGDLFHNVGGLRFRSEGLASGTAYNRDGRVQGGMGVDWGDYDGDGDLDLFVATYQGEPKSLYRNDGTGLFQDASFAAGLAPAQPYVGFGTRFFDADNDGYLDLLIANGHVLGPAERVDPSLSFAQPLQFFRGLPGGRLDLSPGAGPPFLQKIVGRAAAFGDLDDDGRCDVVIANIEGEPVLLRNETEPAGHWLRVRLRGGAGNRLGIGARVTVKTAQGSQLREVTTASSYLSASDPRLHFGLGEATAVEGVTVRWPGGRQTTMRPGGVDREIEVRAPAGSAPTGKE